MHGRQKEGGQTAHMSTHGMKYPCCEQEESAVIKAIKKVMLEINLTGDSHQITFSDLIFMKSIEEELRSQNLLRPKGCRCNL